jgi:transcription elongation GreA/GreB family factor
MWCGTRPERAAENGDHVVWHTAGAGGVTEQTLPDAAHDRLVAERDMLRNTLPRDRFEEFSLEADTTLVARLRLLNDLTNPVRHYEDAPAGTKVAEGMIVNLRFTDDDSGHNVERSYLYGTAAHRGSCFATPLTPPTSPLGRLLAGKTAGDTVAHRSDEGTDQQVTVLTVGRLAVHPNHLL